ncbi:MAG: hypothetical protein JNL73_12865 [Anaerolineales bacterium]|nr:hypothetical protein [Anaerolineales bacterium]
MSRTPYDLPVIVAKAAVTHTVTYFVIGLLASTLFDYAGLFAQPGLGAYMRAIDDRWVMAGPLFQPVRGALFGLVIYLLRQPTLQARRGWLTLWFVLVAVGILNTFGPTPGSIEGLIYTQLPLATHLRGLPEVLLQSLLLSVTLYVWVNHPRPWLTWALGITCAVLLALPVLGLLLN